MQREEACSFPERKWGGGRGNISHIPSILEIRPCGLAGRFEFRIGHRGSSRLEMVTQAGQGTGGLLKFSRTWAGGQSRGQEERETRVCTLVRIPGCHLGRAAVSGKLPQFTLWEVQVFCQPLGFFAPPLLSPALEAELWPRRFLSGCPVGKKNPPQAPSPPRSPGLL